ncbi:hypothetical protein TWF506_009429 [Arthrobotrys conoides]|uniref:Uncharacterized protein n=1 Tax=Arthrobotrys conoides TaxID=74498 RepID=A0AAN8RX24_9PEZI
MLRKVVVVTASLGAISGVTAVPLAAPEPAPVAQSNAIVGYNVLSSPSTPTYW